MERPDVPLAGGRDARERAFAASTRAYERSRFAYALCAAWPAALIALACALWEKPLALAAAILVVTVAFHVVGRGFARGVWPGLAAGVVPLVAAVVSRVCHTCPLDAAGGACSSLCLLACGSAGLVAGALIGFACRRDLAQCGSALVIAALVGAIGCWAIGLVAVLGMAAALVVAGAVPVVVLRPRAAT